MIKVSFVSTLKQSLFTPNIYMHINLKNDFFILLLMLISTLANGLVPAITSILTGRIFDILKDMVKPDFSYHELYHKLTLNSFSIMILGAGCFPIMWSSISSWMSIGERQGLKVRSKMINSYLTQNLEWYDLNEQLLGDFTQLNRCVEELRSSSAEASAITSQSIIAIITLIITSFYYSWSLTLIILCGSPIICLLAFFFSIMIQKYVKKENTETGIAAQIFSETLQNIQLIKLSNADDNRLQIFEESVKKCNILFIKMCLYFSLNTSSLRFLTLVMFVQGFWFGSTMIHKGHLQISDVITCFSSCLLLGSIISTTLNQIIVLQKGKIALEKILNFLKENDNDNSENQINIKSIHNNILKENETLNLIEFNDISFCYPSRPNDLVLKKVNVSIPKGKTTFIIGKSGSGKSTLSNLLLKFYKNYEGDIMYDGISIANLQENFLFEKITLIEQNGNLFDDTLRNNVLMGLSKEKLEKLTDIEDKIKAAIEFASLETMVKNLPNGIHTTLGKNGIALSGGQQQRVALARAFIRNTDILILDEATSALDPTLQSKILENIRKWRSGKTTIMLTHNLNQINNEDLCFIFKNGRMIEQGYKGELILDEKTEFSKMISVQNIFEDTNNINDTPNDELDEKKELFSISDYISSTPKEYSFPLEKDDAMYYMENSSLSSSLEDMTKVNTFTTSTSSSDSNYDIESLSNGKEESILLPLSKIILLMIKSCNQKVLLSLGLLCGIIAGITNPLFSWSFSYLLNGIIQSNTGNSNYYLIKWSCIVIGISIADGASNFFKSFLLGLCSEYWVMDLRIKVMNDVLAKKFYWFSDKYHQPAELSALLLNDLRDLRSLVSEFLSAILTFIVVTLLGLIWALVSGWKLSLVCISMFPLIIIFSLIYGSVLQKCETDYKSAVAKLENLEFEIITKIKSIKSLQLEEHFLHSYGNLESKLKNIAKKRSITTGLGISLTNTIVMAIEAILYFYGFKLILIGEYTSKKMFTSFTLLLFTVMTCNSLINQIPDISRGQRAISWIYRILEESDEVKEINEKEVRKQLINGDVSNTLLSFKNLHFEYPNSPKVPILNNVNFNINSGQKVAIVGESGCGKSTILLLITKLLDAEKDMLFIDETDITNWDYRKLREGIALVEQKPRLLRGSIRDNILCGNSRTITDFEIYDILRYVGIYDFIMSLPYGIETKVDAGLLSGGQAQRLCISRALLRKPKILLLDECTSALDPMNTQMINELIKNDKSGMTIISVTHSESMMKACKNIVMLANGTVVEEGTYTELSQSSIPFKKLLNVFNDEE